MATYSGGGGGSAPFTPEQLQALARLIPGFDPATVAGQGPEPTPYQAAAADYAAQQGGNQGMSPGVPPIPRGDIVPQSPVAAAGQPGAAGYSAAGAAGAGTFPTTRSEAGFIPPPSPLEEPQLAAIRALTNRGWNPGSFHPFVQAVINRAKDLSNELVLKNSGNLEALADPTKAIDLLTQLIGQGGSGGKIFGGGTKESISGLVEAAQRGNQSQDASMGDRLIASLLSDKGRATSLFQESLYGGMTPTFQKAMSSSLIGPVDTYGRSLETDPEHAAENFLQYLLGRLGDAAPTGGYVSPWTPAGQAAAARAAAAQAGATGATGQ